MTKKLLLILTAMSTIAFNSCKKTAGPEGDPTVDLIGKEAPDGFSYSTTRTVDINVRLLSRTNQPISGVLVSFYKTSNIAEGAEVTKVLSDDQGFVKTKLTVASSVDSLIIDPAFIGLMRNAKAYIGKDGSLSAVIGGENGFSGNIVEKASLLSSQKLSVSKFGAVGTSSGAKSTTEYVYNAADFDNYGRPKNLEPVDKIDFAALMKQVNEALPEQKKVKDKYIATEVESNLNITALSDVWITFFHEGADYRNSLGYYTYPTGKAPKTANEISKISLVFPNASLKGATGQGTMIQGDKVKIGRFAAGTSIGFVVLQNAYESKDKINYDAAKFYSNEELNPEQGKLKRHNVILNNTSQKTFLIGFEDINRTDGNGSDNDFNDVVVYAQSNPVEAISPINIPYLDEKVVDTDGDGVPDVSDEYPTDPKRAYNRYYPSKNTWGTIAFEDQWPGNGDYDLNDLVVSYRYKFAMSSINKVVNLTGDYKGIAAGATFDNGFGVQLPLRNDQVASVTGQQISKYVSLGFNGVEAKQDSAVIIPFDFHRDLFNGIKGVINTQPDMIKTEGKSITVEILFSNPLEDYFTAQAPFNPFLFRSTERSREVHLMNRLPTTLADRTMLQKEDDTSNPNQGRYYVTKENRPFGIDIYGTFNYPLEGRPVTSAYLHFAEWAKSGGTVYTDWYSTLSGYRDNSKIYTK